MATDDLLRQGIAALKAGHKAKARTLLMQVTQQDKRNEMAWLWLSGAVETKEERRTCLERVLDINPKSAIAQKGLAALTSSPQMEPAAQVSRAPAFSSVDSSQSSIPGHPSEAKTFPLKTAMDEKGISHEAEEYFCSGCGARVRYEDTVCPNCSASLSDVKDDIKASNRAEFSLSKHAAAGAVLASLIGTLWVLQYLLTTQYGSYYFGHQLWGYVTGIEYGLGESGAEPLFIVVTRFLLAFGLSWGPMTTVIAFVEWGRR